MDLVAAEALRLVGTEKDAEAACEIADIMIGLGSQHER
jgi:hypothetical protein